MPKLFDLAKNAWRRVAQRRVLKNLTPITQLDPLVKAVLADTPPKPPPGPLIPPPVQSGRPQLIPLPTQAGPTDAEKRDIREVQEVYDNIQLLGRDQGHDVGGIDAVMKKMRRVKSSNVWGYYFEVEGGYHQTQGKYRGAKSGILYVTFLAEAQPGGKRPNTAGPTYAYFDVPVKKFEEFQQASEASAGKAVWDYLRVRGTTWEHQHRYRLTQVQGDYIPRKATGPIKETTQGLFGPQTVLKQTHGFKTRTLLNPNAAKIPNSTWSALSRLAHSPNQKIRRYAETMRQLLLKEQGIRRSTLPERSYLPNRAAPNRGTPNRGR